VPVNQVKDREREGNKRRDKRKDITTLGSSGCFCWWLGSSGGRRAPRGLPVVLLYALGACCPSSGE